MYLHSASFIDLWKICVQPYISFILNPAVLLRTRGGKYCLWFQHCMRTPWKCLQLTDNGSTYFTGRTRYLHYFCCIVFKKSHFSEERGHNCNSHYPWWFVCLSNTTVKRLDGGKARTSASSDMLRYYNNYCDERIMIWSSLIWKHQWAYTDKLLSNILC